MERAVFALFTCYYYGVQFYIASECDNPNLMVRVLGDGEHARLDDGSQAPPKTE
jgi:hypothetical protein